MLSKWRLLPVIFMAIGCVAGFYALRHANEFFATIKWEQVDHDTLMLFKGSGWAFMGTILIFTWPAICLMIFGHPTERIVVKLADRVKELEDMIEKQTGSRT